MNVKEKVNSMRAELHKKLDLALDRSIEDLLILLKGSPANMSLTKMTEVLNSLLERPIIIGTPRLPEEQMLLSAMLNINENELTKEQKMMLSGMNYLLTSDGHSSLCHKRIVEWKISQDPEASIGQLVDEFEKCEERTNESNT